MSEIINPGGGGGSGSLTVGTTTISGGTSGYSLYDNGGVLSERSTPYPAAGSNLTWYVATTGSDSNPGTIGSPFLTIQHAVNVAVGYDYQNLYFPTINVANGTYVIDLTTPSYGALNGGTYLPPIPGIGTGQLIGIQGLGGIITGNVASPSSVVLNCQTNSVWAFFASGFGANWTVQGFEIDSNQGCYLSTNGANLIGLNTVFNDSSAGGLAIMWLADFYSTVGDAHPTLGPATSSIIATTIANFAEGFNFGLAFFFGTYTLPPGGLTVTASFLFLNDNSFVTEFFASYANANLVTGAKLSLATFSGVVSPNGPSDVPGNAFGTIDGTSYYLGSNGAFFFGQPVSGAPTTSNLLASEWGIFKDTTQAQGLGITIKYNDAGTIYNVGGSGGGGGPPLIIF